MSQMMIGDGLQYQSGFGNHFSSEAVEGALPTGRNSPQRPPLGLYAEQLSGTAFTAPRNSNRRSWLYRMRPSASLGGQFKRWEVPKFHNDFQSSPTPPDALRWSPFVMPSEPTDFLDGLRTIAGNGSAASQTGCAIYVYACNRSMERRYLYSADGELVFVAQIGTLVIHTELGQLTVSPGEVAVVPRGIRFRVDVDDAARGYLAENFGSPMRLPELGPIGANGLANPRDFLTPVAAFEEKQGPLLLVAKFMGKTWAVEMDHSPLDVVAWHGNYCPYKYDLHRFNVIGSISYDHPDPSIFTVLTSPSDTPGTANMDVVAFAPRWLVAEDTFRPPWYHRNVASEFMGLIHGEYDAKASGGNSGFSPGGASLHNCMIGHGPDAASFEKAVGADTRSPQRLDDTMAFMFETRMVLQVTDEALNATERQWDYVACWTDLERQFELH